jgi:hypothetical protein
LLEAIDAPAPCSVSCCQDEPDGFPFVEAQLLQDEICGLSIQMAVFSCQIRKLFSSNQARESFK